MSNVPQLWPSRGTAPYQTEALGYQQLSVTSGAAVSLTVPNGATTAVVSVETAAVRWRDDGTAPTTTVGMPIAAAAAPFVYSGALSAIQFIAQSTTATVDVSYYR